jgi:hypothetical protein
MGLSVLAYGGRAQAHAFCFDAPLFSGMEDGLKWILLNKNVKSA